jgi:hypothetical protein
VAFSSRLSTLPQARAVQMTTGVEIVEPGNSTGLSLHERGLGARLQKIKCGINGAGFPDYDEGRRRFGAFMDGLEIAAFEAVKFGLQNAICNHETCDLYISFTLEVAGLLAMDSIDSHLDEAFDELRLECTDKGGMGGLFIPKSSGVCGVPTCTADGTVGLKLGSFEAQYYSHDGGSGTSEPAISPIGL